jgi:Flp pilus assembly protein CpaB
VRRGRSTGPLARWLLVVALTATGALAALALLAGPQAGPLARLGSLLSWPPRAAAARSDLVAVPISAVAIAAYTKVTRQHLIDARNQRLASVSMEPVTLPAGVVTDLQQILGRVLARDKSAGYVFMEDDFLPAGTRPGLVAGIPPGKRAMRLDADRLHGIHGLLAGDRLDVIASLPVEARALNNTQLGGVYGAQLDLQARASGWQRQASVRVVAEDALIIAPPAPRSSLPGRRTGSGRLQEVVIAVEPEEVSAIAEALSVRAELTAIPRSGRPDDVPDARTSGRRPRLPFTVETGVPDSFAAVETIRGVQRGVATVPRH